MPLDFKASTAARNAAGDAAVDLLDAANPSPGVLEIRSGDPPATADDADAGSLLATLILPLPAFGNFALGEAASNAVAVVQATGNGVAGHFRCKDGNGNTIFQGTCGEFADTPNLLFNNKTIVAGGTVLITGFTISLPV